MALGSRTSPDKMAEVACKAKSDSESQSWRPTGTTIGAASGIDPSEFARRLSHMCGCMGRGAAGCMLMAA
jgi:hypothetical protein